MVCDNYMIWLILPKNVRKLITKVNFVYCYDNFNVIVRSHFDVAMLGYTDIIGSHPCLLCLHLVLIRWG